MRCAAAVLTLGALLASGAAVVRAKSVPRGSASEIERGQCVKRSRDQQRACVTAAAKTCREHFETEVVECFGGDAECAKRCFAENARCRTGPKAAEDGCKLACASDLKVELGECAKKAEQRSCESPARVKALKCKQRCTADTAPKLQECMGDFDDCVGLCVRSAAH